nr:hypothetical protein CFP56_14998 [Quercus suber]
MKTLTSSQSIRLKPWVTQALVRMRAIQIRCTSQEVSIGHLKAHQAFDREKTIQYKEAMWTLNAEIGLEGQDHRA